MQHAIWLCTSTKKPDSHDKQIVKWARSLIDTKHTSDATHRESLNWYEQRYVYTNNFREVVLLPTSSATYLYGFYD